MNNIEKTHNWILEQLHSNSHVIDMTCGNGFDTKFLAKHCKKVTAIDIQEIAVANTKKRTRDFDNITYLCQDHSTVDFLKKAPIHGAVYNLGYLPHGDKNLITKYQTTLESLNNLFPFLEDFLVITCYPGHSGGDQEALKVLEWIENQKLNPTIFKYDTENSPIAYCISLR